MLIDIDMIEWSEYCTYLYGQLDVPVVHKAIEVGVGNGVVLNNLSTRLGED